MNLQLCIPYRPCPKGCPMCIAVRPKKYENLFAKNHMEYIGKLSVVMCQQKYETVVLTGDTEPTLDDWWLNKVITFFVLHTYKPKIEIQTHNYNWKGLRGIDVNAFSVTSLQDLTELPSIRTKYGINRLVVLGTKELMAYFLREDVDLSNFQQLTIKALQHTASQVAFIDDYIDKVKCDTAILDEVAEKYAALGLQVKVDLDCQNSINRYAIFREDGEFYKTWDE